MAEASAAPPAAGQRVAIIAIIVEWRAPASDTDAKTDTRPHPAGPDPDAKPRIEPHIRPLATPLGQTLQEIRFKLRRADLVVRAPLATDLVAVFDRAIFPHAFGMASFIGHDIRMLTDPGT